MQNYKSWIIVGTVGGFVGGVAMGVVIFILFKRFGLFGSRRNKTLDLSRPREITNDTNGE